MSSGQSQAVSGLEDSELEKRVNRRAGAEAATTDDRQAVALGASRVSKPPRSSRVFLDKTWMHFAIQNRPALFGSSSNGVSIRYGLHFEEDLRCRTLVSSARSNGDVERLYAQTNFQLELPQRILCV